MRFLKHRGAKELAKITQLVELVNAGPTVLNSFLGNTYFLNKLLWKCW